MVVMQININSKYSKYRMGIKHLYNCPCGKISEVLVDKTCNKAKAEKQILTMISFIKN